MNIFTQEAVVCPYCRSAYTLGQFTPGEMRLVGKQARRDELARVDKMLGRVRALVARYPKIEELYATTTFLRYYSGGRQVPAHGTG